MPTHRIDKPFILSDSSVNVYGFKLLTSGYQLSEFERNPIGYYNHTKEDGILLKWEDLKIDGDQVIGYPVVNLEHPRAQRTISEVENGFLNSASVGKLCILDYVLEDNPADPEQPIMVATSWYNKECSLVDNPGNRNAMAVELEDADGNELNLADMKEVLKQNTYMSTVNIPLGKVATLLNLSDDATADAVVAGIEAMHNENQTLAADKAKLEKDLADEQEAKVKGQVSDLLDKAVGDKKITVALRAVLQKDYSGNPTGLKDLLDNMPVYVPVADRIKKEGAASKVVDLMDKSYDELDRSGQLADLKANDFEGFKAKYKAKFNKEYKGKA